MHLAWARLELTTLVVIVTDFTGSCISKYHPMTAPNNIRKQIFHCVEFIWRCTPANEFTLSTSGTFEIFTLPKKSLKIPKGVIGSTIRPLISHDIKLTTCPSGKKTTVYLLTHRVHVCKVFNRFPKARVAQWVRPSLSPIRRWFTPGFVNYKAGALDSQPQVIKFTSCLPMIGGFLRVLRLLPPLKLVAMI